MHSHPTHMRCKNKHFQGLSHLWHGPLSYSLSNLFCIFPVRGLKGHHWSGLPLPRWAMALPNPHQPLCTMHYHHGLVGARIAWLECLIHGGRTPDGVKKGPKLGRSKSPAKHHQLMRPWCCRVWPYGSKLCMTRDTLSLLRCYKELRSDHLCLVTIFLVSGKIEVNSTWNCLTMGPPTHHIMHNLTIALTSKPCNES